MPKTAPPDPPSAPDGATAARRRYGGVAAEQRADERRTRLLDSAMTLFATQGYARTPIEQLCAEARVTARHFYELFDSREALLAALYDRIIDELNSEALSALQAAAPNPQALVTRVVGSVMRHYIGDARRARIGVLEVVGVSAAMEQRRRAAIHGVARLIEQHLNQRVRAAELPPRNYRLISIAVVGGINELLAEWLTAPNPPQIDVLIDEVALMCQALLTGAAAFAGSTAAAAPPHSMP